MYNEENKIKHPLFLSYFPLYAYSEETSNISSVGPEQSILVPSHSESFFESVPSSVLIHPRFGNWKSSIQHFDRDLPFACSLFMFRFDIISSKKRIKDKSTQLVEEFVLFEYHTLSLLDNIRVKIKVYIDLVSVNLNTFNGSITYKMQVNSQPEVACVVDVILPASFTFSKQVLNYANTRDNYLNDRFLSLFFYQVLSTQSIFLRVKCTTIVTSRSDTKKTPSNSYRDLRSMIQLVQVSRTE